MVLGIKLDPNDQVARPPADKFLALQELIASSHSHMIDLICSFRRDDHPIHLYSEFKLDLQWWHQFLSSWHGFYFWLFPGMSATPDLEVTSDASGSLGFGASFQGEWFNGSWVSSQASHSIPYKELFAVVLATQIWGPQWSRSHMVFRCDNKAVVHILNSRTSKVP